MRVTIWEGRRVSIPSRGFWFFEVTVSLLYHTSRGLSVSIPSRGFWFFEGSNTIVFLRDRFIIPFQSPRGDFGFLK